MHSEAQGKCLEDCRKPYCTWSISLKGCFQKNSKDEGQKQSQDIGKRCERGGEQTTEGLLTRCASALWGGCGLGTGGQPGTGCLGDKDGSLCVTVKKRKHFQCGKRTGRDCLSKVCPSERSSTYVGLGACLLGIV